MAWQTPKTDWGRPDGVRNTDLNRIEDNILYLYNSALHADHTVYVNINSGSDSSGNGTSSSPYKTITYALSSIPRNFNGYSVIISVAGGTYNEAVTISGFSPIVMITGTAGSNVVLQSLRVDGCCCSIGSLNVIANGAVYVTNGGKLIGDANITVSGYSLTVNYGGVVSINDLVVRNASSYAIEVNRGGYLYTSSISGTGNTSGIRCQSGGIVAYGASSIGVSSLMTFTSTGGRIYTGSQQSSLSDI